MWGVNKFCTTCQVSSVWNHVNHRINMDNPSQSFTIRYQLEDFLSHHYLGSPQRPSKRAWTQMMRGESAKMPRCSWEKPHAMRQTMESPMGKLFFFRFSKNKLDNSKILRFERSKWSSMIGVEMRYRWCQMITWWYQMITLQALMKKRMVNDVPPVWTLRYLQWIVNPLAILGASFKIYHCTTFVF